MAACEQQAAFHAFATWRHAVMRIRGRPPDKAAGFRTVRYFAIATDLDVVFSEMFSDDC